MLAAGYCGTQVLVPDARRHPFPSWSTPEFVKQEGIQVMGRVPLYLFHPMYVPIAIFEAVHANPYSSSYWSKGNYQVNQRRVTRY